MSKAAGNSNVDLSIAIKKDTMKEWNLLVLCAVHYGPQLEQNWDSDAWQALAVLFGNEGGYSVLKRENSLVYDPDRVDKSTGRVIVSNWSKKEDWRYFYYDTILINSRNEVQPKRGYAGRLGNNSVPGFEGDAYVYRGGGPLQLTGKTNYLSSWEVLDGLNLEAEHSYVRTKINRADTASYDRLTWILLCLCYLKGKKTRRAIYDHVHADFTSLRMTLTVSY